MLSRKGAVLVVGGSLLMTLGFLVFAVIWVASLLTGKGGLFVYISAHLQTDQGPLARWIEQNAVALSTIASEAGWLGTGCAFFLGLGRTGTRAQQPLGSTGICSRRAVQVAGDPGSDVHAPYRFGACDACADRSGTGYSSPRRTLAHALEDALSVAWPDRLLRCALGQFPVEKAGEQCGWADAVAGPSWVQEHLSMQPSEIAFGDPGLRRTRGD